MANEVTQHNPLSIAAVGTELQARANQFKSVLPVHITPEKFQRTVLTAIQSDPELLKADRRSLLLACMKLAQDGVLPDKREAALVIFKENKKVDGGWQTRLLVQPMVMVYGLRKKILQSDEIVSITTNVVYAIEVEKEHFIYEEGTDAVLRHRPMLDLTEEDASDDNIVAAYSMATDKDGNKSYEVMRRFEINKVRQMSQTGAIGREMKYGVDRGKILDPKGPWVDWFPEMAKKTVLRRHSKVLPMSGDIIDLEAVDERQATQSAMQALDMRDEDQPEFTADALPSRDELERDDDNQGQGQGNDAKPAEKKTRAPRKSKAKEEPAHDPETGEVPRQNKAGDAPAAEGGDRPAEEASNASGTAEPGPGGGEGGNAADDDQGAGNEAGPSDDDDEGMLGRAKEQIDACDTNIPDINSRVSQLVGFLSGDDPDKLREYAADRIAEIKAGGGKKDG